MEENRRFSWSDLFIKIILVLIFVLFTIWLLSLSNKGLSNSLDVLTDNIFSENIEKMKEVGKDYFTIERLPEKVGEIETLTLQKMYDEKLILELKDKYGNACSAENSYVSIEKYDNEYQMKVYLECGSEKDHIIVIMGCYDYCDTDICEFDKEQVKDVEYEYKKTTGGKWTDYGKWSEWSKVSVTNTNYRQVETKKETEEYSYDKTITDVIYAEFEITCPEGYKMTSDKTKCYKTITNYDYKNLECPTLDGYKVTRNGLTCNYTKTETKTTNLICPTVSGYTFTGISGLTCNYNRTVQSSNYTLSYVSTKTGSYVPADTSTYDYVQIDADYVYDCNNGCAFKWVYTYKVYKKIYGNTTESTTRDAYCPPKYDKLNGQCVYSFEDSTTKILECSKGYSFSGDSCSKQVTNYDYKNLVKTCPVDYKKTEDGTKCYKEVPSTVTVTGTKEVTYYRYRVREYKGGTVDYKWSTSKEDKKLLDAGYKLTGRTR